MERPETTKRPNIISRSFVGLVRGVLETLVTIGGVVTNMDLFVGRMSGEKLDRQLNDLREKHKPFEPPIQAGQLDSKGLNIQEAIDEAARVVRGSFY